LFEIYNTIQPYYPQKQQAENPIIQGLLNLVSTIYNAVAYAYATFYVLINIGTIFIKNAFSLGYIVTNYLGLPEVVGHFAQICVIICYMLAGIEVFKDIRD
jgi:hypothetical protein